jgi:hypothetical protein
VHCYLTTAFFGQFSQSRIPRESRHAEALQWLDMTTLPWKSQEKNLPNDGAFK